MRLRRYLGGVMTAVMLSGVFAVAVPTNWTPICATFEEGSMDWYLFFCFIDPPPKDPRA